MAKNDSLIKYGIIGFGSWAWYSMALRGSLGGDMQLLALDIQKSIRSLGGTVVGGDNNNDGKTTPPPTPAPTPGGGGSSSGWTFANGVWTNPNGARAFVQAEADGTYTAVYQSPTGAYEVISGQSHVSRQAAESAVHAFVS